MLAPILQSGGHPQKRQQVPAAFVFSVKVHHYASMLIRSRLQPADPPLARVCKCVALVCMRLQLVPLVVLCRIPHDKSETPEGSLQTFAITYRALETTHKRTNLTSMLRRAAGVGFPESHAQPHIWASSSPSPSHPEGGG